MSLHESTLQFEGLQMRCFAGGSGFPILLLHGSGPGASTASTWHLVLPELEKRFRVLAADLIGFGRSARKASGPFFDIELWVRQAQFLLNHLAGGGPAGFIGHSLSANLGIRLAARNPSLERVLASSSPGYRHPISPALLAAWSFPRSVGELKTLYSKVVANPANVDDSFFEERFENLNRAGYGEYYEAMFAGDKQSYLDQLALDESLLAQVRARVLFVHGIDDQIVTFNAATQPLLRSLERADAVLLNRCGHAPAIEQPAKFLAAVDLLFD